MIKYKLTDQDLKTFNDFQWEVGKEYEISGIGELCSDGWLHYYHHPLLAILMNPIHADIKNPRLWEVEANGDHLDDKGLKGGCTKMKLVKELPLPEISLNQKISFGILCSLEVYKEESYVKWANDWLSGRNRTASAARTIHTVHVDDAASYAASYAADAVYAYIADAYIANASYDSYAGYANDAADDAAVYAASAAASAVKTTYVILDLISIAKKAMTY